MYPQIWTKVVKVSWQTTGAQIRRERMARGLSVRQVAKLTDLSPCYISMVENGKTPAKFPPETYGRIVQVFSFRREFYDRLVNGRKAKK